MARAARLAAFFFALAAGPGLAQEKPLQRDFVPGLAFRYRIQLKVRSEIEGQQSEQIGAKSYVKPFSRSAGCEMSWIATRRVVAIGPYGGAEVEETLDDFTAAISTADPADEQAALLGKALVAALAQWGQSRTLRYREARNAQLLDLKPEGAPSLDENQPPVLTLWLLRALRPAAALPASALRFGEPWQEPRTAELPNWSEVRGSESGEWLDAAQASEPAAKLHTVQQISATVIAGPDRAPEGDSQARFHGESLATVSLGDARLFSAMRSATREITWTLAAVEGLPERPQFRSRISVEVQIESCDEGSCSSAERPALPRRR